MFRAADLHAGTARHLFVADMQFRQSASRLAECPEILRCIHQRQTRQALFQIIGKGGAVVRAVQEAVNIIENIFFGNDQGRANRGLDIAADLGLAPPGEAPRKFGFSCVVR